MEHVIALGLFEALTRRQKVGLGAAAAGATLAPDVASSAYGAKGYYHMWRGIRGIERDLDKHRADIETGKVSPDSEDPDLSPSTERHAEKMINSFDKSDRLKDFSPYRRLGKLLRRGQEES